MIAEITILTHTFTQNDTNAVAAKGPINDVLDTSRGMLLSVIIGGTFWALLFAASPSFWHCLR